MTSSKTRKCCGTEPETEHVQGCRFSPLQEDGTPRPQTPAQARREKAANAAAEEQAESTFGAPTTEKDNLPDERIEWDRSPGFRRMKMEFSRDDREIMDRMQGLIERAVFDTFIDAYQIMNDVWDVVREAEEAPDPITGELKPVVDAHGYPVWKKSPASGKYYEDWSRLGLKQRENLLFEITTRIFDWEQRKERLWTEAMFAKALFTERFAIEYDSPMSGTIDDRNAVGNRKAAEDRYFALMQTSVSRRADSVVRTMNSLAQRLKDVIQSS